VLGGDIKVTICVGELTPVCDSDLVSLRGRISTIPPVDPRTKTSAHACQPSVSSGLAWKHPLCLIDPHTWAILCTCVVTEDKVRTNIVIDDELMRRAMRATGLGTKRAVVQAGLRLLLQVQAQTGIRRLRGKVRWEASLRHMRAGRTEGT